VNASDGFYARVPGFSRFTECLRHEHYHPLPEDWSVVLTDVRGSSRAIAEGRYKEVNAMAAASVVAVLNAVRPLPVPYVFGGDGTTACVPETCVEQVQPALVAARDLAAERFDLDLRIGVVPLRSLRACGYELQVAKFQPHADFEQAMFSGTALGMAEEWLKDPAPDNPYLIRHSNRAEASIFRGFECRWAEIPSPHEETVALLVEATDPQHRHATLGKVLEEIVSLYGDEAAYHPVREHDLRLAAHPRLLRVESGVRTAFQPQWRWWRYLLDLEILRFVGSGLMAFGVVTGGVHWGRYKRQFVLNSDYRKFDERLRMVIAGNRAQRDALTQRLEGHRLHGRIHYGLHVAPSALVTCIVNDYDKNHLHLLDASNGGYALASAEMKRQKQADPSAAA